MLQRESGSSAPREQVGHFLRAGQTRPHNGGGESALWSPEHPGDNLWGHQTGCWDVREGLRAVAGT